jgi:hypothetical protein
LNITLLGGIATNEQFGVIKVKWPQFIAPEGLASSEGLGTILLAHGTVNIDQSGGINTGEQFGDVALKYQQFIVTAGIISAETIGATLIEFCFIPLTIVVDITERVITIELIGLEVDETETDGAIVVEILERINTVGIEYRKNTTEVIVGWPLLEIL